MGLRDFFKSRKAKRKEGVNSGSKDIENDKLKEMYRNFEERERKEYEERENRMRKYEEIQIEESAMMDQLDSAPGKTREYDYAKEYLDRLMKDSNVRENQYAKPRNPIHENLDNKSRKTSEHGSFIQEIQEKAKYKDKREKERAKKEKFLKENQYAQVFEKLLRHIRSGEKLTGDENYVLAQYNFDNSRGYFRYAIFKELKSSGVYVFEEEIPEIVKEEYYDKYNKINEEKKEAVEILGLAIIQKMGIVDLKDKNVFKGMDEELKSIAVRKARRPDVVDNDLSRVQELPKGAPDNALITGRSTFFDESR